MQYLKEFDEIENNGVDSENNRYQSCEHVSRVDQSSVSIEENKIFNVDESNRKLTRQIREKSESLIHFIESVTKLSNSLQSNKNCTSNDVSVIIDLPKEREIPLHRVVEFMKKARANKKYKRNLELSNQIKKKSESLTDYIASTNRCSSSYQSTDSDKTRGDRKSDHLKNKNNDHNSDVSSSEYHGKKYYCFFESIKSDEDYDW